MLGHGEPARTVAIAPPPSPPGPLLPALPAHLAHFRAQQGAQHAAAQPAVGQHSSILGGHVSRQICVQGVGRGGVGWTG